MAGSSVSGATGAPASTRFRRRLPVGTEYVGEGHAHARVWAPAATRLAVVTEAATPLAPEGNGYFSGAFRASPGQTYQLRVDEDTRLYPDPASRFQPEGPHGPSELVDPDAFAWSDAGWRGRTLPGQVIYEMHVGTFTRNGTWQAAIAELDELRRIGITTIEVMPVADFEGRFGWGYDGVNLYAPTRLYGRPDDFRAFVDAAHRLDLAVILDVVYNHFGSVGNYLRVFSPGYFTTRYENEWGDAINFDGPDAEPVREFFVANAGYWIEEFHLDGLRLDATQQIYDGSPEHILTAIGRRARQAAGDRDVIIVAENEPQETRLVRPVEENGYGLDALWNDDFHHSAMVALTGRAEAYYSDTTGHAQEFISAAKYGYLFQGQPYHWQRKRRGSPSWGLPPSSFVVYLQNHDQVANSARGLRGHQLTSPGRWRAMTALFLLAPSTPLIFQGQEFSASSPFLYFADMGPELAEVIRRGRAEFLTQFPSIADYEQQQGLDDPADPATFSRCVLDFGERQSHAAAYALHQDLLGLRREDSAFREQRPGGIDGAVLTSHAFLLRFFTPGHLDDRVLMVNLGADLSRASIAEPLLAPPSPKVDWTVRWSSEAPAYGGGGTGPLWTRDHADAAVPQPTAPGRYLIPGESALVLAPGGEQLDAGSGIRRRTA